MHRSQGNALLDELAEAEVHRIFVLLNIAQVTDQPKYCKVILLALLTNIIVTSNECIQPWWLGSLARHLITEVPSERWIESH